MRDVQLPIRPALPLFLLPIIPCGILELLRVAVPLLCLCGVFSLAAEGDVTQEQAQKGQQTDAGKETVQEEQAATTFVETEHSITTRDGRTLEYTAVAATLRLEETQQSPAASIFYVAYNRKDIGSAEERPIMFCFNGGPGSSSVWLHLGAFGPMRVLLPRENDPVPPPYGLVENVHSILDTTDLVFIDPVSTGYSRAIPEDKSKAFHSVTADIRSVSRFIRLYATRFTRWGSPKYVAGESYGGLRAAGVAAMLHDDFGMDLNGVLFISPVLNFQTIAFDPGNDLPSTLVLPSYTASAWYHGELGPDLQKRDLSELLRQAEDFASGEYISALFSGAQIAPDVRETVAQRVTALTGLDATYVTRSNLRIHPLRFSSELLREKRLVLGRFDARETGFAKNAVGEVPEYDPSYHSVYGPFATAFNHYVKTSLDYPGDEVYRTLASQAVHPWGYESYANRYVNVTEDLRRAMTKNQYLRVFVASGTYDLATPYFATDYTVRHLWVSDRQQKQIVTHRYDAGHMFYTDVDVLEAFAEDVRDFIHPAAPTGETEHQDQREWH